MILDSSAVVALLLKEPDHALLRQKMIAADVIGIGAPTLVESGIVLSARMQRDARGMLARFIDENEIIVIPFTEGHYGMAMSAWMKYGKGRHPAGLNIGDCLSYSVAKVSNLPLLCIGNDFPQTDLTLA